MNLVGKILIVALLVMSLVFASMTLAVHATHKNWALVVSNPNPAPGQSRGLVEQVADKQAQIDRINAELTEKNTRLERTIREYEHRVGQLQTAMSAAQAEVQALDAKHKDADKRATAAIEQSNTTARLLQDTERELAQLRDQNLVIKKDRDDALAKVKVLQDDVAQATGRWNHFELRNKQLRAQLAQVRMVIRDAGLPEVLEKPTVFGLVTATHTGEGLVEINLGKDQGLKKGDAMDVFRFGTSEANGQYMGRIYLINVDSTRAVGQVDRKLLTGTIQKDDHVASRL